ncbi:MAG: histidine kinase, partial [Gammaproteobacteria bacterium]|nr:histidine kinase [Gammaproteobacteria bacterium]
PNNLAPGPSTKSFGTGLGIPIAFKICQQHGWILKFDSTKGMGTTAIIVAPIRVIEEVEA